MFEKCRQLSFTALWSIRLYFKWYVREKPRNPTRNWQHLGDDIVSFQSIVLLPWNCSQQERKDENTK